MYLYLYSEGRALEDVEEQHQQTLCLDLAQICLMILMMMGECERERELFVVFIALLVLFFVMHRFFIQIYIYSRFCVQCMQGYA